MTNTVKEPGWRLMSQLFSYPDRAAEWPLIPTPADMAEISQTLLSEMDGMDPVELQNEYTRLFINALPHVPCAPYGSVYLEGSVMGSSTVELYEIYDKYGLSPRELPDHIAVECEFLAWLHRTALHTPEARRDYQTLSQHLKRWAPAFLDCVVRHDPQGCYGRAAGLAAIILNVN